MKREQWRILRKSIIGEGCQECTKRELWRFVGRQTYYGYDYWVWQLVAHPRGAHNVGKLWAVKCP